MIKNRDKKFIIETYLDGVEFENSTVYHEEAMKLFPESKPEGRERTKLILNEFSTMYRNSRRKVAHIAVTHGFFVNKFSLDLMGRQTYADYCSISGATINGDEASLILDSYSSHIVTW